MLRRSRRIAADLLLQVLVAEVAVVAAVGPVALLLPSFLILDTDVVEDGRDSPEAIIGVHVSNFMRLY